MQQEQRCLGLSFHTLNYDFLISSIGIMRTADSKLKDKQVNEALGNLIVICWGTQQLDMSW